MNTSDPNPPKASILIVDDNPQNLRLLSAMLTDHGYKVRPAPTGPLALKAIQSQLPDMILLDINMPELNGYEVCKQLKNDPVTRDLPVIFISAMDETIDKVQAFQAGGVDYITKPFHFGEVLARIETHLHLRRLQSRLENKNTRLRQEILQREKVEAQLEQTRQRELVLSSRIQQTLLFDPLPQTIPGLVCDGFSLPSQGVDGDFYVCHQMDDTCFDLIVGDVVGKGVAAAFLGAAIKARLLRIIHTLCLESPNSPPDPRKIVSRLNDGMNGQLIELETYATIGFARFNLAKRQLSLINCGNPPVLHYSRASEPRVIPLGSGANFPLGLWETCEFHLQVFPWEAGDLFLFCSDGVFDARVPQGELFGLERLSATLLAHGEKPPRQLADVIRDEVVRFTGTDHFLDDFTCLTVKVD